MRLKTGTAFILVVMAFIATLCLYPQMPNKMASHWNANGEVDGYIPKLWGLFLIPTATLMLWALFLVIPRIDPLRKNIKSFIDYYETFVLVFVLFMLYTHLITILWNFGYQYNMNLVLMPAMAGLFFYVGVLLEKAKRNWFIGVRTPWTLSSDTVWKKTHKIGSKLFKIYAIILVAGTVFQVFVKNYFFVVVVPPIIIITVGLFVYSYFEYEKEMKNNKATKV